MPPRSRESRQTLGKAAPGVMDRSVYPNLGEKREAVLVGPGRGLDNAAISLPDGGVMILTVDPVSMIPAVGARVSAWLSVHLIASDITASGVDPEFAAFSYNFPPEVSAAQRDAYLRSVGDECKRLGIAIVGGNTGSYPGSRFTVIGAGTMLGASQEGAFVTPAMAMPGDSILMTKHAAIEATASLASSFPGLVAGEVGDSAAARARAMLKLCTTVGDAQAARKVGLGTEGITSMHDATEGGILGALDEMSSASGRAFAVDPGKIPVSSEAASVCSLFGLNPLETMSEGALLITCRPQRVEELLKTMRRGGGPVTLIGSVGRGHGLLLSGRDGRTRAFRPGPDGYWGAYERASSSGSA